MRRFICDALEVKPAPVGHNGGPPLDLGFTAWAWRRAHAKAWDNPGREVVMLRLRRAARLGLGYRDYTSVLLDRGAHLAGLIVMLTGVTKADEPDVVRKFATLSDCSLMLCGPAIPHAVQVRLRELNGRMAVLGDDADHVALRSVLGDLVARSGLPPAAIFLVGSRESERRAGESLGLGLFVEAKRYFQCLP